MARLTTSLRDVSKSHLNIIQGLGAIVSQSARLCDSCAVSQRTRLCDSCAVLEVRTRLLNNVRLEMKMKREISTKTKTIISMKLNMTINLEIAYASRCPPTPLATRA